VLLFTHCVCDFSILLLFLVMLHAVVAVFTVCCPSCRVVAFFHMTRFIGHKSAMSRSVFLQHVLHPPAHGVFNIAAT